MKILKVFLFIVILGLIATYLEKLLILKGDYSKRITNYYEQKNNTLDIVNIGTSHIQNTINPAILWNEYGITSYDLSGPTQPIWISYYYMVEALKTQKPKLIIIDTYGIIYANETNNEIKEGNIRNNIDNMNFSMNKFRAIEDSIESEDRPSYMVNLMKYHTRWKEIKEHDFSLKIGRNVFKGYLIGFTIKENTRRDVSNIIEMTAVNNKNEEYLHKLINLAKEKNIELLFVSAPYPITENEQKIANSVYNILEEENISYIDYNLLYDELNLDFGKDFRDISHLNSYGAIKVTNHLGNYIKENYDIPDHRQDPEYAYWWDDTQYYYKMVDEQSLKTTTDIKKWIEQVQNSNNYIVLGSYKNTTNNKISEETIQNMKTLGGDKLSFSFDIKDNYAFIIDNGQVIYEKKQKSKIAYKNEENWFKTRIDATTSSSSIKIEAVEYSKNKDGINIVVYDKVLEKVVDSVNIGLTGKISR
jgi:hypothetical protein